MTQRSKGTSQQILKNLEQQAQTLNPEGQRQVLELLEFNSEMKVDDLAGEFQILWQTGTNPGSLELKSGVPEAAILKAALAQPGISRARAFMLQKLYDGQASAEEALAMDREEQAPPDLPTHPMSDLPAHQRPELEQVEFLEKLMEQFSHRWMVHPLFQGLMRQIVDERPIWLMKIAEDPQHPERLQLGPLIILMALADLAVDMTQEAMLAAMIQRQQPEWSRMPEDRQMAAKKHLKMEVTENLGATIGSISHGSKPLQALISMNDMLATLNLKSAGLPNA